MIRPEFKELIEKEGNSNFFVYKNYNCKIIRVNPDFSGHLCGYVQIPQEHEFYQKHYDEIDCNIPAHGGLTFSGSFKNNDWWIGFDCAHYGDLLPCYHEGLYFVSYDFARYMTMQDVENCIKEMIDFMEEEE